MIREDVCIMTQNGSSPLKLKREALGSTNKRSHDSPHRQFVVRMWPGKKSHKRAAERSIESAGAYCQSDDRVLSARLRVVRRCISTLC